MTQPTAEIKDRNLLDKWHTLGAAMTAERLMPIDTETLYQLIEKADSRSLKTFVAAESIAAVLGVSKDTIERSITRLIDAGFISLTGEKRGRANVKLIHLRKADKKYSDHSEFWSLYPKKEKVGEANKLLDIIQASNPDEYKNVLGGVRRYVAANTETERRYIKRPDNWLKEKYWLDDFAKPEPRQAKEKKATSKKVNEKKGGFKSLSGRNKSELEEIWFKVLPLLNNSGYSFKSGGAMEIKSMGIDRCLEEVVGLSPRSVRVYKKDFEQLGFLTAKGSTRNRSFKYKPA